MKGLQKFLDRLVVIKEYLDCFPVRPTWGWEWGKKHP